MADYPQSKLVKSKDSYFRWQSSLFYRSLVREFSVTGALVSSILLSIIVFTQLIKLLGDSVSGILAVEGVLTLVGFGVLNALPLVLSVSLYLAVLLTLTRSYRDSEMIVWFSSGIGLTRWIRPVLGFSLPIVLLIAVLSLVLAPWAKQKTDEFKSQLDTRDDVSMAKPGLFRESSQADRVFFLENIDPKNNRVSNIFVQSNQNGKQDTMVAKFGLQETDAEGNRYLVLLNGARYEGIPGQADYKIVEFARYTLKVEAAELKAPTPTYKETPTLELLAKPTQWHLSELAWRIGAPISALILVLLAIPLSFVNPRAGRSLNLLIAVLLYMTYNNLLGVSAAWIGQGKINPSLGLWGMHAIMLIILIIFFANRLFVFSWKRWRA